MPTLLDVLYPWPVVSTLALNLGVGDLLQLSRVNSAYRAVLHGFPRPERHDSNRHDSASVRVRPDIFVGHHQSSYWKNLKSTAQMSCAEPHHRRGYRAELCRYCSFPICDACVVRESFDQVTSAWRTRTRHLCVSCWADGTPHQNRTYSGPPAETTPYTFAPGEGDFCQCTAADGWICAECRRKQCTDVGEQRERCFAEGCQNKAGIEKERRSVCLWCDLPCINRAPLNIAAATLSTRMELVGDMARSSSM
ncbi:hypothetical protein BGW36DRAFT_378669 [Talaromyces proteolyticus]|uniref:F-box domain-containing protein n=1 Tax=Talaromyces proteolyticus TaxID=1131652 RepID=A0AAD4KPF0_9EURO|nr:uncharacterized protein BGW36DRAFT_378669 [Talaromyces proteolyticus]KAH8697418.1 hypothetical protein BGW36DRAFT_378669 [Talaromyces proteolyticus]